MVKGRLLYGPRNYFVHCRGCKQEIAIVVEPAGEEGNQTKTLRPIPVSLFRSVHPKSTAPPKVIPVVDLEIRWSAR